LFVDSFQIVSGTYDREYQIVTLFFEKRITWGDKSFITSAKLISKTIFLVGNNDADLALVSYELQLPELHSS
jgi:hypothetical protein